MTTAIRVPVTTVWRSPDAARPQDAAITADVPEPAAWNENLLAEPPSALHGRTVTQALLGEPVRITGGCPGWLEVTLPWQPSSADSRGYPGWVPAAHVGDAPAAYARASAPRLVVTSPTVPLGSLELSYGTVLPVADGDARSTHVVLPDGTVCAAPNGLNDLPDPGDAVDAHRLLDSARQFVGMRYLWGGTSGWGFDCSGYVHLLQRRFGRAVPRDAFDQIEETTPTDMGDATYGDLYFFATSGRVTHVGFTTNEPGATPRMLQAPDSDDGQFIQDAPLSEARRATLIAAGTFPAD